MPKTSLQLIQECQQRGLLSKEAAAEVLEQREHLIKTALKKQAAGFFSAIRGAARGGGTLRSGGEEASRGILSKLRTGGLTPPVGPKGSPTGTVEWSDVAANLGKMLALAGLTAGATAGVGGIIRHSKDKKLRQEIDRSYKMMFKEHPRLRDLKEDRPGTVERNFGILAKYAPSLAADPTVAGTWVSSAAQMGQVTPGEIKQLAETQKAIDQSREDRGPLSQAPLKMTQIASKALLA